MFQKIEDKADAAEARTQQTRVFMQRVRAASRRKHTPEEKVRIVLEGFRREVVVNELCRRDAVRDATRQEIEQIKRESTRPPIHLLSHA